MKLENIDISIVKAHRKKTLSIFIERDGTIRALVPVTSSQVKIENAIKSKEYLIYSKLAKWKELNQGKVNRNFVNGQSFLYLGKNYRLSIVNEQDVPLKISGGFLKLHKKYINKSEQVFKTFYKEKARNKINERLKVIGEKFSDYPKSIKVIELRNRWASWSPSHSLNFHWKCAMAPVAVLDYIITHEMVHLKHPNHSKQFWNELDKKMPNYKKYENWLKQNGVKMSL